jgi:hypothetical protein
LAKFFNLYTLTTRRLNDHALLSVSFAAATKSRVGALNRQGVSHHSVDLPARRGHVCSPRGPLRASARGRWPHLPAAATGASSSPGRRQTPSGPHPHRLHTNSASNPGLQSHPVMRGGPTVAPVTQRRLSLMPCRRPATSHLCLTRHYAPSSAAAAVRPAGHPDPLAPLYIDNQGGLGSTCFADAFSLLPNGNQCQSAVHASRARAEFMSADSRGCPSRPGWASRCP